MPKKDIDYSKCVIYKIVCNNLDINDLYVGSTTEFTKRKYKHKNSCFNNNYPSYYFKVYDFIRNNGGWHNWTMIEIEKYPCNDGHEARARERYWCEQLNANLNTRTPITIKEPKKERVIYKPCIYKYPEYYKDCKISSFNEAIERNKEYYLKKTTAYHH